MRPSSLLLIALGLAPASTAMAFVAGGPTGDDAFNQVKTGAPERLHVDHVQVQHALSRDSLPWQNFKSDNPTWQVRWDESTGTPLRMYGEGLDLGPVNSDDGAERAASLFIRDVEGLMGVSRHELELVGNEARGELRFVTFQRTVADTPVEGAVVTLWFKYGKLIMAGLETHPGASKTRTHTRLSNEQADRIALAHVGTVDAEIVEHAERVILPNTGLVGRGSATYTLAWKVRVDSSEPTPAQYYLYVDAQTGAVFHQYNDVRFAYEGHITGAHEVRTVGDELVYSPIDTAKVNIKSRIGVETNADGLYSIPGRGTVNLTTLLDGPDVRIQNSVADDPEAMFEASASGFSDYAWEFDGDAPASAVQVYVQTRIVQDRTRYITPDNVGISGRMIGNVEIADSCNAFYNGRSINFFQASEDCNNTGRIADIVFHEYGHHYHSSLVATGSVNGSIGEGSGDYLSATITGDSVIGPNFLVGGGAVREIETNRVYPADLTGEVHADGLIWAGAMWDLRKRLIEEMGEDAGIDLSDHLFATALMSGPSLPTAYEAVLVADDDDGDLANGTPNLCGISEEFGHHGLGPGVAALFAHSDEPQASAGEALSVSVDIASTFEDCLSLNRETAKLLWSNDLDGAFNEVSLTAGEGDSFSASIPAHDDGTLVYYTFSIEDSNGELHSANNGQNFALFQVWFGELEQVVCEDFEAGDGAYTHELIAGEVGDGADDWMWGTPAGGGGDPKAAASGNYAWGNDLAPEGFNGLYQGDKVNALHSTAYSTEGHSGVILRYRRWLNVEDGSNDQATVLVNDQAVWQNEATDSGMSHTEDRRWTWHYVSLGGLADDSSAVTLSWELATNPSLEFGGWTVDDVCLFATQ